MNLKIFESYIWITLFTFAEKSPNSAWSASPPSSYNWLTEQGSWFSMRDLLSWRYNKWREYWLLMPLRDGRKNLTRTNNVNVEFVSGGIILCNFTSDGRKTKSPEINTDKPRKKFSSMFSLWMIFCNVINEY